ncbi:hypothetical protein [Sessilibacter corallicola]|uniref:hypothetical protein n=1 Tax=Sessilibacter corallicola TaxID=2904075 RepID=UPI001E419C23|nr:hypothetical protein [Sessilibacter corallicola]MCE2027907.1 hypothetical protein [Sessilibacter corallicola]
MSFSERREYSKVSLDYYLLTPNELSQLAKYCENNPQFTYSAADGPKPIITHLHCHLEEETINSYAIDHNFEKTSNNLFKREQTETEIEFEKNGTGKIILTTVYEYL